MVLGADVTFQLW